jgi:hypothetical protein
MRKRLSLLEVKQGFIHGFRVDPLEVYHAAKSRPGAGREYRLGRLENFVAADSSPAECEFSVDLDVLECRSPGGTAKRPCDFPNAGSVLDVPYAKATGPLRAIRAVRS